MRDNRPSDFSQILQQVVFSYLVVYCKIFFRKNSLRPQGPKWGQKTPKKPQTDQNHTFALYLFIHPSDLYEILPKFGDTCYEHKSIILDPEKTRVRVPRGLLGLKIHPFWVLFGYLSKISLCILL